MADSDRSNLKLRKEICMEQKTSQPSIISILRTDYTALLSIAVPVVFWALFLLGTRALFFFYLGIIATLVGIPIFVWRIHSIKTIFSRGIEITCRITKIWLYRDRGRVEYTYTYQGQTYNGGNAIQKTERTKMLQPGLEVPLIIDSENPKRAIVKELYV